jgi:galactoside O-acetyltransferase
MNSFYSDSELADLGLSDYGQNVKISRNSRFYNPENISIGDNVRIDDFALLSGDIKLGSYIHIAAYCGLWGESGIEMGDFSGLSSRVSIYSSSEDYSGGSLTNPTIPDEYRPGRISKNVILEKHTLVGANTVILPGSHIQAGGAIGAQSLLRGETVPSWELHAGNPIEKISNRNKTAIKKLEREFMDEYSNNKR